MAAFSDEEVALAGGLSTQQEGPQPGGLKPTDLPDRARDQELHETLALARQTIDSDPQQVIRDCILLHEKLGIQAPIYEVAGEAYIRLQLFGDGNSTINRSRTRKHGRRRSAESRNLAAMRGDQRLAIHWLELLVNANPTITAQTGSTPYSLTGPKNKQQSFSNNLDNALLAAT